MATAPHDPRPFVGREPERLALARHLDAVRDGGGRVVLIAGYAGIGKTRLAEVALADLPTHRVLWGRCPDLDGTPAFWPWSQALRQHVDAAPIQKLRKLLRRGGPSIARLVPSATERVPELRRRAPDGPELESARFRLFEGVRDFLHGMVDTEPHAIVLDDLHWADVESLLLLRFLGPELRGAKLLVVGTYRDRELRPYLRPLLTDLARTSHLIRLDPLEERDVAAYLAAREARPPSAKLVAGLHAATGGNAFHLTEVVDLLERTGRLAPGRKDVRIDVPDAVRSAIHGRLAMASKATRRVLDAAAVLGQTFDLAILAAVLHEPPDVVLDALAPAIWFGAVLQDDARPGRYRLAHALMRDTLLDALSAPARATWHRTAAEALEEHARERLGEIAHHWFRAAPLGTVAKAVDCSTRAGIEAYGQLGFEAAAGHFARALAAGRDEILTPEARRQLCMQLGMAENAAGHDEAARAAFIEAAVVARDLGDDVNFAIAAASVVGAGAEVGTVPGPLDEEAVGLLEEALRRAGSGDTRRRVYLLGMLSALFHFTDVERRHRDSAESLAVARRLGEPLMLTVALQTRTVALWEPGRTAERRRLSDECAALIGSSHWPLQVATHLGWRIYDELESGDLHALHATLARLRTLAARSRLPRIRWHVALVEATLAHLEGRLDDADRFAKRAVAAWTPSPRNNVALFYSVQRYLVCADRGRFADIVGIAEAGVRTSAGTPFWRAGLAFMYATLGRRDDAMATIAGLATRDFADLPRDGNLLTIWAILAETCARLDARHWAEPLLARLAPHAGSFVVLGTSAGCLGSAARYAGLLAHTLGRYDEAVAHFEAALAANRTLGALPQEAYTQADLARTLAIRGADARAAALRDAARATGTRLGLAALAEHPPGSPPATVQPRRDSPAALAKHGDVWRFSWGDESTDVRDTKGVAYLTELLRHPGREFHAAALGGHEVAGDAGEVLDAEARRAYKARLGDLRTELDEATEFNDLGRATRLQEEMDVLEDELRRATGLGGRTRRVASGVERARLNVTRAIRSVIRKVEADCPVLGRHLERSVQTGIFCAYEPDPTVSIVWNLPG